MAVLGQEVKHVSNATYLDYLQLGVMVLDDQYNIVYWNRWLEDHSNIMAEDVLHRPFANVFPDLAYSRLNDLVHQAIEEQLSGIISPSLNRSLLPLYPSINHQLKQMDWMHQMVQVSSIRDENGRYFALVQVTDMTHSLARGMQLRSQSQAIKLMSGLDALTALAHREKFDSCLQDEFRRAQRSNSPLILGLVEVDYFKVFKEHYGQVASDNCLVNVASVFQRALTRSTDLAARYSAEVFAVVLPNTNNDGAIALAELIKEAVSSLKIQHEASTVAQNITVSIGLSHIVPVVADALEAFVEAAEFALAKAKDAGGDRIGVYTMKDGQLRIVGHDAQAEQLLLKA